MSYAGKRSESYTKGSHKGICDNCDDPAEIDICGNHFCHAHYEQWTEWAHDRLATNYTRNGESRARRRDPWPGWSGKRSAVQSE